MTADQTIRTLVVANRTASTPALLEEVRRRSGAGARFDLMVPPERGDLHDWTLDEAKQMIEKACRDEVECVETGHDAVQVTVIPPEPNSWKPIEFPPEWGPHAVGGLGAY
jgi:hypothetical protein